MARLVFRKYLLPAVLLVVLCGAAFAAEGEDQKQFGSVGLQVVPTINGHLVVLHVMADSPAAVKGLLPGDLIVRVDDFDLQGSDFSEVVSKYLWGPVGTSLTLHFLRPGIAGPRSVVLQRVAMPPKITVSPSASGN